MRICQLCNTEMVKAKMRVPDPYHLAGCLPSPIIRLKTQEKRQHSWSPSGTCIKTTDLETSVLICPECGKIEWYLPEEQLKEFKNLYKKQIDEE